MQEQVNQGRDLLNDFLRQIVEWAPKLIGALIILLIGFVIAKAVAGLVKKALAAAKLDIRLHNAQGGNLIQRAVPSPTNLVTGITFWALFLGAISLSVGVLGIPLLTDLIRGVYAYLPNVIAAIIIFLTASAISLGATSLVNNVMGDTPTGKLISGIAPAIIMGLAIFMILNQLGIAPAIVTITYAALVGSVALGSAIAFGLGGQDTAARMLEGAYRTAQENKAQAVADTKRGASRARSRMNAQK